jgi:hypothetical protein
MPQHRPCALRAKKFSDRYSLYSPSKMWTSLWKSELNNLWARRRHLDTRYCKSAQSGAEAPGRHGVDQCLRHRLARISVRRIPAVGLRPRAGTVRDRSIQPGQVRLGFAGLIRILGFVIIRSRRAVCLRLRIARCRNRGPAPNGWRKSWRGCALFPSEPSGSRWPWQIPSVQKGSG